MSVPLHIQDAVQQGVTVLRLDGHLVADENDRLLRERVTELAAHGARFFLIDLSHVSYVDSGGLGAIIEMYNAIERLGGRLALLCPSACADRVLEITHLASVFDVFRDEGTALRTLAPSGAATSN